AIELDAHLVRERPPSVVIRTPWRTARIREVVRVVLRLHHVQHLHTSRLAHLDDEQVRQILLTDDAERRRRLVDVHADIAQRVDELDHREKSDWSLEMT